MDRRESLSSQHRSGLMVKHFEGYFEGYFYLNQKRYTYNKQRDPTMLSKGPNQIILHFYNKLVLAIAATKKGKTKQ